jgi:hypothetical protein
MNKDTQEHSGVFERSHVLPKQENQSGLHVHWDKYCSTPIYLNRTFAARLEEPGAPLQFSAPPNVMSFPNVMARPERAPRTSRGRGYTHS